MDTSCVENKIAELLEGFATMKNLLSDNPRVTWLIEKNRTLNTWDVVEHEEENDDVMSYSYTLVRVFLTEDNKIKVGFEESSLGINIDKYSDFWLFKFDIHQGTKPGYRRIFISVETPEEAIKAVDYLLENSKYGK